MLWQNTVTSLKCEILYKQLADNPRKLRWTILNRFIVADTDTLKYLNRFVLKVI